MPNKKHPIQEEKPMSNQTLSFSRTDSVKFFRTLNKRVNQYFKENNPIIFLGVGNMTKQTVRQYQLEERSLIAARAKSADGQLNELLAVMVRDHISKPDKVGQLKKELAFQY